MKFINECILKNVGFYVLKDTKKNINIYACNLEYFGKNVVRYKSYLIRNLSNTQIYIHSDIINGIEIHQPPTSNFSTTSTSVLTYHYQLISDNYNANTFIISSISKCEGM